MSRKTDEYKASDCEKSLEKTFMKLMEDQGAKFVDVTPKKKFKGKKERIRIMREAEMKEKLSSVNVETCNSFLAINHKKCLEALAQQKKTILKDLIKSLPKEKDKINPETGMEYYKDFNKGGVNGWNDCLWEITEIIKSHLSLE